MQVRARRPRLPLSTPPCFIRAYASPWHLLSNFYAIMRRPPQTPPSRLCLHLPAYHAHAPASPHTHTPRRSTCHSAAVFVGPSYSEISRLVPSGASAQCSSPKGLGCSFSNRTPRQLIRPYFEMTCQLLLIFLFFGGGFANVIKCV